MDLVNTVRKDGSRGGRADFKWTDVQADQHRENYLGHSVMAPVGRWQKGKDLQWYSRDKNAGNEENDGLTEEERARKERQEEIARIKQAEREAMNKALGYEVNPDGPLGDNKEGTGANATVVTGSRAFKNEEVAEKNTPREHRRKHREGSRDRTREHRHRRRRHRSDSGSRSRSRNRSRERHRRRRSESRDLGRDRRQEDDRKNGNSPSRRRQRSRSVSRDRTRRERTHRPVRSRSRSPYSRRDSRRHVHPHETHTKHRRTSRSP